MQSLVNIGSKVETGRALGKGDAVRANGAARHGGARVAVLLLCVLLLGLAGCAKAPYTGRSQLIMYSEADEMKIGLASMKTALKKEKVLTGTPEAERVTRVGRRIAAVAERPQYTWEFHTVEQSELNAFCAAGGKVVVFTGLLALAESDDELAAVMGHEVAHALARHTNEKLSRMRMAQVGQAVAMVGVAAATGSAEVGQSMGDSYAALVTMGLTLPNSREQEYEADHIGLLLMAKAGYDPHAAVSFWQKMLQQEGGGRKSDFLSTHPAEAKRIDALRAMLPEALRYYRPRDGAGADGKPAASADKGGGEDGGKEGGTPPVGKDPDTKQADTKPPDTK